MANLLKSEKISIADDALTTKLRAIAEERVPGGVFINQWFSYSEETLMLAEDPYDSLSDLNRLDLIYLFKITSADDPEVKSVKKSFRQMLNCYVTLRQENTKPTIEEIRASSDNLFQEVFFEYEKLPVKLYEAQDFL